MLANHVHLTMTTTPLQTLRPSSGWQDPLVRADIEGVQADTPLNASWHSMRFSPTGVAQALGLELAFP